MTVIWANESCFEGRYIGGMVGVWRDVNEGDLLGWLQTASRD